MDDISDPNTILADTPPGDRVYWGALTGKNGEDKKQTRYSAALAKQWVPDDSISDRSTVLADTYPMIASGNLFVARRSAQNGQEHIPGGYHSERITA